MATSSPPITSTPGGSTTTAPISTAESRHRVLRRGGVAGLAGSAAMVGAFVVVSVFPLPSVSDAESLTTYPDLVTGRVLENSFYLAALVLWAAQFIAIGRALDDPATGRPPIAPWVGAFGLLPLAAGALIHVSTASLSDRYSAPDATPADQEMMVAAWAAAQSVFDALLVTGAVIVPLAVVALSWPLMRSAEIGNLVGRIVLGLGIVGSIGGIVAVVDPASAAGVASSILTTLAVHGLIGWRLVRS